MPHLPSTAIAGGTPSACATPASARSLHFWRGESGASPCAGACGPTTRNYRPAPRATPPPLSLTGLSRPLPVLSETKRTLDRALPEPKSRPRESRPRGRGRGRGRGRAIPPPDGIPPPTTGRPPARAHPITCTPHHPSIPLAPAFNGLSAPLSPARENRSSTALHSTKRLSIVVLSSGTQHLSAALAPGDQGAFFARLSTARSTALRGGNRSACRAAKERRTEASEPLSWPQRSQRPMTSTQRTVGHGLGPRV